MPLQVITVSSRAWAPDYRRAGCAASKRVAATLALLLACTNAWSADWAPDAVWYQIFPERFANGDPQNDPTSASLAGTWPYAHPDDWQVSPWTSDWYHLQPWERNGKGFYYHAQLRRYGGDLQGVLDRLDYLQSLGVNALYLNPVFESPSLHKYGAALYHHVDKHFGPSPQADRQLLAREDPADPATWHWSAADRLFLKLIREAHARDMKVVIDGVFNHVGIPFWALERARREGPASRYASWFRIKQWDDPTTPADEFDWHGWAGVRDLPEFRKGPSGPDAEVKAHFRAILQRWMDPNRDGDPADGIDGWRLDVAKELPLPFWREFRTWVEAINPDAYLTGEIWWEDYHAVRFTNAAPWLTPGPFDGVMNYRFGDAVLRFFNDQKKRISASQFRALLEGIEQDYGYERWLALQNVIGSHDTSRLASAVANPDVRLDHDANLAQNGDYRVRKPNRRERQRQRQIVAFMFVAPGAPYIYYGDEAGMWGADDPDCRKPMVWPELNFEPEKAHPLDQARSVDPVSFDPGLHAFYRSLAMLRRQSPALRRGSFSVLWVDDPRRLIAVRRQLDGEVVVALFHAGLGEQTVGPGKLGMTHPQQWVSVHGELDGGQITLTDHGYAIFRSQPQRQSLRK